ncbi:MAG: phosphotransferase family protein [Nitrospirota bacterium]
MPAISIEAVQHYLQRLLGGPVKVLSLAEHGKQELAGELKAFGYGTPVFVDFEAGGIRKQAVLETMTPSSFGHEHFSDRAQAILWEHSAFNKLPRHVRSLDCGAFLRSGAMISTGTADEFFLLTEFADGQGYFRDLDRITASGETTTLDRDRARALSDYLAEIHARKFAAPSLYTRRIRDLVGHGECIMGLIDNYPDRHEFIDQELLRRIELACIDWRWRIRHRGHRLCQVHGDFHPWNILFRSGVDFTLLDRSRGEWGEPADDVACLTINYLFSSLLRSGRLEDPFESLFLAFWENYLTRSQDAEMREVIAPFYAWRGLVIGSPVWYPHLPAEVRRTLFTFIENVLSSDRFDHTNVNGYLR